MRYDQNEESGKNVEDRRGQGGGGFPGGIQIPMGGGGMSLTTMLIVGAVMLLFGFNPLDILTGGRGGGVPDMPQMPRMDPNARQHRWHQYPGAPRRRSIRSTDPGAADEGRYEGLCRPRPEGH